VAVTSLDATRKESGHMSPVFLPGGRQFLFHVIGSDHPGTYLGDLDSPTYTQLSPYSSTIGFVPPDKLFYVRDRTLFSQRLDLSGPALVGDPTRVAEDIEMQGPTSMFSVSASGSVLYWTGNRIVTQPTWYSRSGAALGTVGPPGAYANLAVSPDGAQVLADTFDSRPGIWALDVARGTATRQTSGPAYQSTPLWTPDGKAFVFASSPLDTPLNLFFKPLGANSEERLTTSVNQSFPQTISPDGQSLVYVTMEAKTRSDLWLLRLVGDRKPAPLLTTPSSERLARVSPDGRWLAYVSDESGAPGVFVTRFPAPAGKWQVSTKGGNFPHWSRDGRELFYIGPGGVLMAVRVTLGIEFTAGAPMALFSPPDATIGSAGIGSFYDVAPDGRFLINRIVERTSPPAVVVLNRR
jgi:Tol biopolymer transport system component